MRSILYKSIVFLIFVCMVFSLGLMSGKAYAGETCDCAGGDRASDSGISNCEYVMIKMRVSGDSGMVLPTVEVCCYDRADGSWVKVKHEPNARTAGQQLSDAQTAGWKIESEIYLTSESPGCVNVKIGGKWYKICD